MIKYLINISRYIVLEVFELSCVYSSVLLPQTSLSFEEAPCGQIQEKEYCHNPKNNLAIMKPIYSIVSVDIVLRNPLHVIHVLDVGDSSNYEALVSKKSGYGIAPNTTDINVVCI